ncbi:hypothetical protein I0P70_12855 [Pontibacter sp. FD36]|uniref:Uncharacterized protein n=1 Tax=Pontibacter lucknowensis TaxID=1077936 RepID=A0A1N6Y306_9BACT|nr:MULTISPECIES: hypothetical protein [Pontibacter]EJF11235.1 hypothetical protein O71_04436 [Pontibacter sp. BAB1700]MBF8964137.1 hypothetical protein [Pontibacter sp. FD36]SIR09055.1 hypothetical protein SAMN05421545_2235 [Pontibacter lucknowensis]
MIAATAKPGEMMTAATEMVEIYANEAGAVFQCDRRNRLMLYFAGALNVLKVDTFLRLKQAVASIDLEQMAANPSRSSDYEIVAVCGCERCFILSLTELYALRDLLEGAKFSLELNRMLHECLTPLEA